MSRHELAGSYSSRPDLRRKEIAKRRAQSLVPRDFYHVEQFRIIEHDAPGHGRVVPTIAVKGVGIL
ncbi:MAG: hypothetical protein J2P54_20665 [Bradyrhizobiaceae bacterium]|nr:hypothetical protein [Bradyrhizobiaceae bacterium]